MSSPPFLLSPNVRSSLCCPITRALLVDPVKAPDGHTYERTAIIQAIKTNGKSPITRQLITVEELITDFTIKHMVEELKSDVLKRRQTHNSSTMVSDEFSAVQHSHVSSTNEDPSVITSEHRHEDSRKSRAGMHDTISVEDTCSERSEPMTSEEEDSDSDF